MESGRSSSPRRNPPRAARPGPELLSPLSSREQRDSLTRRPLKDFGDSSDISSDYSYNNNSDSSSPEAAVSLSSPPTFNLGVIRASSTPNELHERKTSRHLNFSKVPLASDIDERYVGNNEVINGDRGKEKDSRQDDEICHRDIRNTLKEKRRAESIKTIYVFFFSACFIFVAGCVFSLYYRTDNNLVNLANDDALKLAKSARSAVKAMVNELKMAFPSQSPETWKSLGSNVVRIASNRSDQAACFVVLSHMPAVTEHATSDDGQHKVSADTMDEAGHCFARAAALKISSFMTGIEGSTPVLSFGGDKLTTKTTLFEEVRLKLRDHNAFALIDADKMTGDTAMALHALCDSNPLKDNSGVGDEAYSPYAHSALLLTVRVSDNDLGISSSAKSNGHKFNHFEVASRKLKLAWSSHLKEDTLGSLLSRVALNVLLINPEMNLAKNIC